MCVHQRAGTRTWICSEVHWSRLTDFTLDMCTPRFLWIPAHRMQINTPRFQEAHLGPDKARTTDCYLNIEGCLKKHMNMHDPAGTLSAKSRLCILQQWANLKTRVKFLCGTCYSVFKEPAAELRRRWGRGTVGSLCRFTEVSLLVSHLV